MDPKMTTVSTNDVTGVNASMPKQDEIRLNVTEFADLLLERTGEGDLTSAEAHAIAEAVALDEAGADGLISARTTIDNEHIQSIIADLGLFSDNLRGDQVPGSGLDSDLSRLENMAHLTARTIAPLGGFTKSESVWPPKLSALAATEGFDSSVSKAGVIDSQSLQKLFELTVQLRAAIPGVEQQSSFAAKQLRSSLALFGQINAMINCRSSTTNGDAMKQLMPSVKDFAQNRIPNIMRTIKTFKDGKSTLQTMNKAASNLHQRSRGLWSTVGDARWAYKHPVAAAAPRSAHIALSVRTAAKTTRAIAFQLHAYPILTAMAGVIIIGGAIYLNFSTISEAIANEKGQYIDTNPALMKGKYLRY